MKTMRRFDSANGIGIVLIMAMLLFWFIAGCGRGRPSDKPPIHPNPNMDSQPKYKAQSQSNFFEDRKTMRKPVEGTIPRGWLREDDAYFRGRNANDSFIKEAPVPLSGSALNRGRERFDIYCSVCHGQDGYGKGIIVEKGFFRPPSFHIDRIKKMPDGQVFDIITNGIRNMPAYRNQIPVEDRWMIIRYLRILQRNHDAPLDDTRENREITSDRPLK